MASARVGRISDRATFEALRRSARRVRRGPLTVTWVPGAPWEGPRVAYAVGRKVGGAVDRNRLRRRLRAICAEAGPALLSGAYLMGARSGAAQSSFEELREYVYQALEALTREDGDGASHPG